MSDVWVTSKGEQIPMAEMTEGHLRNAIAWVERRLDQANETALRLSTLEGPPDYFEDYFLRGVADLVRRRRMLYRETARREDEPGCTCGEPYCPG